MGNANTKESRPEPAPRRKSKSKPHPLIIDPTEMVDGGYLFPQGVYSGPQDFKASVVRDRIIKRQMAPFYKGLNDYDPQWDDERVLAEVERAGWHPPEPRRASVQSTASAVSASTDAQSIPRTKRMPPPRTQSRSLPRDSHTVSRIRSNTTSLTTTSVGEERRTQTIWLYRSVHECPICFLMYPRLNSSKCCSQDICTECFVQIKRAAPHPPHNQPSDQPQSYELISEPAACPYCQCKEFGITFEAPPFEWGIPKPPHAGPIVITNDMLRPDWEYKLQHARRKVAKRSAAAQALHQSALLPNDDAGLTPAEREQRMIEQAIKASLREQ